MIVCIKSVVPSSHSIGVDQWDDFENEFFKKNGSLFCFRKEKITNTIENM